MNQPATMAGVGELTAPTHRSRPFAHAPAVSLPAPVLQLEQSLKTFHQQVNDILLRGGSGFQEHGGELRLMMSLLEDVMSMQGKIATVRAEQLIERPVPAVPSDVSPVVTPQTVAKYFPAQRPRPGGSASGEASSVDLLPDEDFSLARLSPECSVVDGDSDDDDDDLRPFLQDVAMLKDCTCHISSESSAMTSSELESILDTSHRHLYHEYPPIPVSDFLDVNMDADQPPGAPRTARNSSSSSSTTDENNSAVGVMACLMPVVNNERQHMSSLFSATVTIMRMLCAQQQTHHQRMASMQQAHRAEFGRVETAMTKKIVQLVQAVQRQDVEIQQLQSRLQSGCKVSGKPIPAYPARRRHWLSSSVPDLALDSSQDDGLFKLAHRASSMSDDIMPSAITASISSSSSLSSAGDPFPDEEDAIVNRSQDEIDNKNAGDIKRTSSLGQWISTALYWWPPESEPSA